VRDRDAEGWSGICGARDGRIQQKVFVCCPPPPPSPFPASRAQSYQES